MSTNGDVSIGDVLASLKKRGFYKPDEQATQLDVLIQLCAVVEEAGEVSRMLRRHFQRGGDELKNLGLEAADVAIAAVCLAGVVNGEETAQTILDKMHTDEKRGLLHANGK